ncbi:MAG: FCD domain-containing protein [Boseongicola sp.]|nr:MAG: FCD domain-containing protein [Boseongicola sp.]
MSKDAKSKCLEDLKRRILSMDLQPGSDLDEAKLSAQYGISRTPFREVLQRLSGEGYIRLQANRGAKVASMDLPTMRVFFQTAPLVYSNISYLAAENRTSEQLDMLKELQVKFAQATKHLDPNKSAITNFLFHELIGQMAHNSYLMACMDRLLIDHTRLSQTFYRPAESAEEALIGKAVEQHDALITAIEARESALAMELTLQHWDLSRDRMERFVRPDPLPANVVSLEELQNAV